MTLAAKGWWFALITSNMNDWKAWFEEYRHDIYLNNFRDDQSATPLHWACLLKNKQATKDLLKAGASMWSQDNEGNFPFKIAMTHDLSKDWNWKEWPSQFPNSFLWSGKLHPARQSISRHLYRAAQKQKWDEVEALMKLVPFEACPAMVWEAPRGSSFDKMFSKLGPTPWAHVAVLLQSKKLLEYILEWGAPLFQKWSGYSLDEISELLTDGKFDKDLFQIIHEKVLPSVFSFKPKVTGKKLEKQ